jgi:hypothetical protein
MPQEPDLPFRLDNRVLRRLGAAAGLALLAVVLTSQLAAASWWSKSVSTMDVRGITLGMSLDQVARLHPELQLRAVGTGGLVGGKFVPLDPSLVEHELTDGNVSCGTECFSVDFASPKQGGGAYDLSLRLTTPRGANVADLLADMEKKYGSPSDLRQIDDVPDETSTVTASWGMGIDASAPEAAPKSGQVLKIELKGDDGYVQVSIFLTDFGVEAADAQAKKEYLAQVAQQQTDQANKALNY